MKIIFDTEEEKEEFVINHCPVDIGLAVSDHFDCQRNLACDLCWSKAVEIEVR